MWYSWMAAPGSPCSACVGLSYATCRHEAELEDRAHVLREEKVDDGVDVEPRVEAFGERCAHFVVEVRLSVEPHLLNSKLLPRAILTC